MTRTTIAAALLAAFLLSACSRVSEWDRAYGIATPEGWQGEPLPLDD